MTYLLTFCILAFAQLNPYENAQVSDIIIDDHIINFPRNYSESKDLFHLLSTELKKQNSGAIYFSLPTPNPEDQDLSMNYLYIPRRNSKKIIIITAGTHGAEAYAGQAIQSLLMKRLLKGDFPDLSFLIIHSINPFGAKYFRRTNADNIDLNRNFGDKDTYTYKNKSYINYQTLFHPKTPVNQSFWVKLKFYWRVAMINIFEGKRGLLEAMGGQYQDPKGTNYGGNAPSKEMIITDSFLSTIGYQYSSIYHIDLHTGYGEKGKLHFFGSDKLNEEQIQRQNKIFEGFSIDTGSDDDFYTTHGAFDDWVWNLFKHNNIVSMVYEFGTMDSHTLFGGLKSLWIFITANQGFHYGYVDKYSEKQTHKLYEELFNPQDPTWQKQVLEQANEAFTKTFERFEKI